jgi:hypothetical protein
LESSVFENHWPVTLAGRIGLLAVVHSTPLLGKYAASGVVGTIAGNGSDGLKPVVADCDLPASKRLFDLIDLGERNFSPVNTAIVIFSRL